MLTKVIYIGRVLPNVINGRETYREKTFGTRAMNCMHLCLWKTVSQDCPHGEIKHSLLAYLVVDILETLMLTFTTNYAEWIEKAL